MKNYYIIGSVAVVALLVLAVAEPLSPPSLGQVEGLTHFCAQLDSQAASKYQQRAKAILGNASVKDIAKARKSDDYKKAYDWISSELQRTPKEDAARACTDFLEDK